MRRSSTVTPVTRSSVVLDAAHEGEVAQLEACSTSGLSGSISGPSTTSAPAQRIGPSGCGSPGDRKRARAVPVGQLGAELLLEQRADGLADGRVGERRALHVQQLASRPRCSPSHSSSAMNGIFSLKAGDGVAQVQCAPLPPTLVDAAAAGNVGACAEPSPPKSSRWVPWRAVNMPSTTSPAGMPSDSRNAPACGPCDISRARAFSSGSAMLRTLSPGPRSAAGRPRT